MKAGRADRAISASDGIPPRRSSRFDIVTILVLYFILFVLVMVFVGGLAGDLYQTARAPLGVAAAVIAVISAGLILLSVAFIYRIFRRTPGKGSASRLRKRLSFAFILMVLIASVPQAILGWRAVTAASSAWYGSGIAESLTRSERLAMDFYVSMDGQIRAAAESELPPLAARSPALSTQDLFLRLRQSRPGISALQAFPSGPGSSFAGDIRYRMEAGAIGGSADGSFPAINQDGLYAIRYLKSLGSGDAERRFLLTMEFPSSWGPAMESMETARSRGQALETAIPRFRSVMALVYLLFCFPLFLASVILAISIADGATRPLASLERATHRVAEGDMGARVLSSPGDDFAPLSSAFNRMVSELDRYRAVLLQEEKENAWQDIARKLAHEVKNPLTPIRLSAERVLRKHRAGEGSAGAIIEPAMLAIIQEVDGLTSLLADFKDFARLPEPQFAWTELRPILADIAAVYGQSHPLARIDIEGVSEGITLKADSGQLRQLFVNLVANAIDAMDGQGWIGIRADLVKYSNTHYCRIEIRDSGPGIPADLQDRLFTPYVTTKENGTGLGLSIAEHIVMSHKGRIWFESEPGAGAAFYVDLPAEQAIGRTGS